MPELVVATRSEHKLREIREILGDCGADLVSLEDLGVPRLEDEEAIECFDSFAGNAVAKAAWFCERTGYPTVADDSGIVVPALDGRPGVFSRRYAETLGVQPHESERDATNTRLLLEQAAHLTGVERRAYYACVAALALPDAAQPARVRSMHVFAGTCEGMLASELRGANGFGYDPVFFVPDVGTTFGEASAETKHRLSHRARAFRALASVLPGALTGIST
jgi:XTP/dITP diphosphohydrolase